MTQRRSNELAELTFLRKLQRLLDEGEFVATYKFALLNALADLCVERDSAYDGSLHLPVTAIAEKFIEYYWPQAKPFRAIEGEPAVLRQNTGPQAAVLNALIEGQQRFVSLPAARRDARWDALVNRVARIVREMPLWKLQTVGGELDEFLYRRAEYAENSIRLLPGVARAFRTLHGLVLDAVRGAWMRQIGRIAANRPLLGDADLATFLFGSERRSLDGYARVLRDHQGAVCLYCGRQIRGVGEVDHFVAWSRYPADLGHNLVLSCRGCNAKKRDYLAHRHHLESWYRLHIERADELAQRCDDVHLAHDVDRTNAVAWWAYEQGESAGAHAWIRGSELERLDRGWRQSFERVSTQRVAEQAPPKFGSSHMTTIQQAADIIASADALLITAGAGMGVDSGLPDFRSKQGFWRAYPPLQKLGLSFEQMAQPRWFAEQPEMAWAWYGHRQQMYRETKPHPGFEILENWARAMPAGSFVYTSNVDGQFESAGFDPARIVACHGSIRRYQCTVPCTSATWIADPPHLEIDLELLWAHGDLPLCPDCGAIARPNILMFDDYEWVPDVTREEQARYAEWLIELTGKRVVIVECGAGTRIATVRREGERIAERFGGNLVRINPDEGDADEDVACVRLPALEALMEIQGALDSRE